MTLYDIKGEFLRLYELADSEEDEEAFLDTLEGLQGELEVKAKGCVYVMKQLEMEEAECDKVIEAFTRKKQAKKNARERIINAIHDTMSTADLKEIAAGEYKIKIVKNGGKNPLVINGEVPDSYMRLKYEVDKELIRKALEDGKALDFAYLGERGEHLSIR